MAVRSQFDEKTCYRCKQNKLIKDFSWRNKAKGTKTSYCKQCLSLKNDKKRKKNSEEYYKTNREIILKKTRLWRKEMKVWYDELKNKPCSECNMQYPAPMMHWHHNLEFTKEYNICDLYRKGNKDKILNEIKKCELLCFTCHNQKTSEERRVNYGS